MPSIVRSAWPLDQSGRGSGAVRGYLSDASRFRTRCRRCRSAGLIAVAPRARRHGLFVVGTTGGLPPVVGSNARSRRASNRPPFDARAAGESLRADRSSAAIASEPPTETGRTSSSPMSKAGQPCARRLRCRGGRCCRTASGRRGESCARSAPRKRGGSSSVSRGRSPGCSAVVGTTAFQRGSLTPGLRRRPSDVGTPRVPRGPRR